MDPEFTSFALGAIVLKVIVAGVALAAAFWLLLPWLDRRIEARKWGPGELIAQDARAAALYYGLRIAAIVIGLALLMGCTPASAARIPDRYDAAIERAVERWWPDLPEPALWKAQLWQESRLRPEAVSPVGARGLAQFMPGTWRDAVRALGLGIASPHDDVAIEAGAWYMAKQRAFWRGRPPRGALERHELGLASYNAGAGNIVKAQARCAGARLWAGVAPCLPAVTGGAHARETTGYVELIMRRWWPMMRSGL
jgi:soluble lytic murein transglycosylase-like protein